jgi:hypothetical protein
LIVAAILLVILPPLLPCPLYALEQLWIAPIASAAVQQCKAFYCPAAVEPERLGTLLVFGPSVLIAVASIFFGFINIERSKRRPTSQKEAVLLGATVVLGLTWGVFFGFMLWFWMYLAGGTL